MKEHDREEFYTVEPNRVEVSEKEFKEFINNYPRKLEIDYYMDAWTYNDFELANIWPYSIVAKVSNDYGELSYYITTNIKEVFDSKTGFAVDYEAERQQEEKDNIFKDYGIKDISGVVINWNDKAVYVDKLEWSKMNNETE